MPLVKMKMNEPSYTHRSLSSQVRRMHNKAPIHRQFSRELSASLNLVSDWAAHPVYDHSCSWLCMPPTQTDAVRNESAAGHSPNSVDWNLTLLWHRVDHVTALCWSDHYQLRQLRPVARALSEAAAKTLVQAFISC